MPAVRAFVAALLVAALLPALAHEGHDAPHAAQAAAAPPDPGSTGALVWQFIAPGTVDFACLEPGHFEAGMIGHITVK
jgi:uncharacterized cupredoxin-like copper-binding protein